MSFKNSFKKMCCRSILSVAFDLWLPRWGWGKGWVGRVPCSGSGWGWGTLSWSWPGGDKVGYPILGLARGWVPCSGPGQEWEYLVLVIGGRWEYPVLVLIGPGRGTLAGVSCLALLRLRAVKNYSIQCN